ncbi:MAG TPA: hypothetical protein VNM90_19640 [Haliangium sp.]|nr:hypothetical protein [Haliangium sp.]
MRIPASIPLLLIVLVGGCIEPPVSPPSARAMCERHSDCDTASGQECREAVCWGDPPAQAYAAVLIPPAERTDMIRTELPLLQIARNGALGELAFVEPVTIEGRVVLACKESQPDAPCDPERSIAAQVFVTPPSRIPGVVPDAISAMSQPGAAAGSPSFVLYLPPGQPGEAYDVTVVPLDQDSDSVRTGPAHLAPPTRFTIEAVADRRDIVWALGDPTALRTVRGQVVDAVDEPVGDMRVFAIASGVPMALAARSSSIDVTGADGTFTLRIPQSALDSDIIDFVIEPRAQGSAPTLRVRSVLVPEPTLDDADFVDVGSFRMPSYGELQPFTVPVLGIDSGGNEVPITQAEVSITTYLETVEPCPPLLPSASRCIEATFSVQAYTADDGNVTLSLIPGSGVQNRRYVARVIPPAGSEHGSIHALDLDVGSTQGGVLQAIRLEHRTAVTGAVVTAEGEPAAGAVVTAALSLGYRWSLEPAIRSTVEVLQQPQEVADPRGKFILWLDSHVLDAPVRYDLEIRPADPLLPQVSWPNIDPTAGAGATGSLDLGLLTLPAASYAQATIVDPDGALVPGAKVGLYAIPGDQTPCEEAIWPGDGDSEACVVPPTYLGPFPSRSDGTVMLVLPNP